MGNTDDHEYIDLVIKGDTNAFAALVNRYKDMVFTLSVKNAAKQGRGGGSGPGQFS